MKKILSMLLAIMMVFGTLTMLCGITANAEADFTTEVWKPVEITFTSTVEYKKPYISTEIDAVFKHTDGTTITLPGFWKEGDTWAVRFSPTKTGTWSYTVTCKDAANTGLNGSGTILATETTSQNELQKHGFVKTVDNLHYYTYDDGTPFFWLGDTNWQAFMNVSTEVCNYPGCECGNQFKHIVDNRVEKGFNVFQTYFVPGAGNGEKSVWKDAGKYERPNEEIFNEKVDKMFEYLNEKGMVIALGLGCHNSTMASQGWDADTYLRFARYIVARYACYSIVWISGQEITNTENAAEKGKTVFEAYYEMSAKIEELDGYKHPNSAHMYPAPATNPLQVTLDKSAWHDSWTIQGGHGGNAKAKEMYSSYYLACQGGKFKPFIEAEVNYEDINCGGFTGYDANRWSAWKSIFCGSAGFTYGVTGIWANCFSTSNFTGWFDGKGGSYNYEPWYMGLDKPGSYEMMYMKEFMERLPDWTKLAPKFKNVGYGDFLREEKNAVMATDDSSTVVAYFYDMNSTETGTLKNLNNDFNYKAYWFNPLTGKYVKIGDVKADQSSYKIPERPNSMDWVFLLTTEDLGELPMEEAFVDLNPNYEQVAPTGTIVTPTKVTAVGGITYKGSKKAAQTMTDNTSYLYDNDPATVWKPFIDRPTQTFVFDLGTAQELSHLVINTVEGTIIPRFRVEGSNNLKDWTIITNTEVREAENPGKASEPLKGGFRYVKVILLNADTLVITEADIKNQPYKTYWNAFTENAYSMTEITDILIYSNGKAANVGNAGNDGSIGGSYSNGGVKTSTWLAVIGMGTVTAVVVIIAAAYVTINLKNAKKKEN